MLGFFRHWTKLNSERRVKLILYITFYPCIRNFPKFLSNLSRILFSKWSINVPRSRKTHSVIPEKHFCLFVLKCLPSVLYELYITLHTAKLNH